MRIALFLFTVLTLKANAYRYSAEDLNKLYEARNFKEFIEHAQDIPPRLRNKKWNSHVQEMAELQIRHWIKTGRLEDQIWNKIEELGTWNALREDENFHVARAEYFEKYQINCLRGPRVIDCLNNLTNSIDLIKKLPYRHQISFWSGVLPLAPESFPKEKILKDVLKNPLSEFYCKKGFLNEYVGQQVDELYKTRLSLKRFQKGLQDLADGSCLKSWFSPYDKIDLSIYESQNFEFYYQTKLALSDLKLVDFPLREKQLYSLLFLLGRPKKGDLLNISFNHLRDLGERPQNRKHILSLLEKEESLPDATFSKNRSGLPHPRYGEHLIGQIYQYFPEFISHYQKRCLSFREGRGPFPAGNPTQFCSDFFEASKRKGLLDDESWNRFQSTVIK